MKSFVRMPKNISVTSKFVAAYLAVLAVSLAACGVYLYIQLSDSSAAQSRIVMEQNLSQTKESIMFKVKMVENLSRLASSDIKLQTFLSAPFDNKPEQYDDFTSSIQPFVDNIMRQNTYIHSLRIYMDNPDIPEVYDSFYRRERLGSELRELTESGRRPSGWRGLHPETVLVRGADAAGASPVFSFYQRMDAVRYYDRVGVMEVEVTEPMLFESLGAAAEGGIGQVFVIDAAGRVVSSGTAELAGRTTYDIGLPELPGGTVFNRMTKVRGKNAIVISMPVEELNLRLVGIFPQRAFNGKLNDTARSIAVILAVALLVLGLIVYLITTALLSRLKVLVRAMKQVREGSLTVSVPVRSNDEFSQIASSFNLMTGRIHELVETVYKIQIVEKEAELRALESQVNPHFLYNTLATISWVARKANTPDIIHISTQLAQFYRLMLNKGRREILVKDEINMVKAYLGIQKFRFEEMFDVVYDIDESVYELCAPKNILQPLVENALVHGIEPKRGHGTLIVKAGIDGDRLVYRVIDDGVGMRPAEAEALMAGRGVSARGSGYGIRNIMERMKGYYGDRHEFQIHSGPGIGTSVTVRFDIERF